MSYTNADGLYVRTDLAQGAAQDLGAVAGASNVEHVVRLDFDLEEGLPTAGGTAEDVYVPAGAFITRAYIIGTEAAAGGTNFTFGLAEQDGSVIDADGIDAAVTTAELATNEAVVCDGALVGGTLGVGTADAYIYGAVTGTYTAGQGSLFVYYIKP
jgi:hypothetical protein